MAKRTCSIDGCEATHNSRGLCRRHYMQAKRTGTLATARGCRIDGCIWPHHARGFCSSHYDHALRADESTGCSIEGCANSGKLTRGWCQPHYMRWYGTGDVGGLTFRRPSGPWIHAGRWFVHVPDHPLAGNRAGIHAARVVLFDKIGYGPHLCHWCSIPISWRAPLTQGAGAQIHADHVNGDTLDDRPDNLVQSCPPCNGQRGNPAKPKTRRRCTVDGCDRYRHGRGLCRMHYQRALRAGELL